MNTLTLPLGPELTIPFAAQTQASLAQALQQAEGPVVLALGGVTEIDSAGIQLLLATRRSLDERQQPLQLQAPSDVVLDALRVFGLQAHFETAA